VNSSVSDACAYKDETSPKIKTRQIVIKENTRIDRFFIPSSFFKRF